MGMIDFGFYSWELVSHYLLGGLYFTLLLTLVATVGGIMLGTVLALMRLSGNRLLHTPAKIYINAMRSIPLDRKRPTVRVVITGEVYCVIDPFANGRLEQRLAQLGAEPCRVLWQTDYLLHGMGLGRLGHLGGRPAAIRAARPYMADDIGGDAAANVGHAVLAKRRGMHGLVHLKPFACMMEFISENVLQKVSEELDFPVLSLTLDDVNGAERIHVRLEAFVENLFRRCASRKSRPGAACGKRP